MVLFPLLLVLKVLRSRSGTHPRDTRDDIASPFYWSSAKSCTNVICLHSISVYTFSFLSGAFGYPNVCFDSRYSFAAWRARVRRVFQRRQTNERTADNNGFAKSCHECDDHTTLCRRKLYKLSFQSFCSLEICGLRAIFGSEEEMHA